MTRRALIIRSGYDPPAGAHNAAECIGQVLQARGFELVPCVGPAATRRGILAAYDELIERAMPEDAVVVYYAGHGGLATNSSYTPGSPLPPHVQHICPSDFAETSDDDFRGISSLELSLKLAALTARTPNATVILDCCFAAQMSRAAGDAADPGEAPVIRPKLTRVGLTRHLEEVRALARELGVVPGTGNPDGLRVAASGQTELARRVSLPSDDALRTLGVVLSRHDGWIGALTLGLVEILAEIGDARVPWRSIATALRARLLVQRPEIEGPVARVPFSLDTVEDMTFAVRLDGDGAIVEAGRLLGVSVGDVYRVVPAAAADDPMAVVATLTIDEVSAMRGRASQIAWANGRRELPPNAAAIATSLALERHPVRIVAPEEARDAVLDALRASQRLRAATEADGAEVIAELRVAGDQLELRDALGPLFPPARFPDRLGDAVLDLANLSTERRLRGLAENGGIAPTAVTLELGRIGPRGAFVPIARHGEPMGLADSFALRLENTTDARLYANVFNIGLRRRIALLSDAWASGVPVLPGAPVYVGDTPGGELRGFGLSWPDGLPLDRPRRDTVMAMITTEPADLRVLESHSFLVQPKSALSPLQELLAQLACGVPRGGMTPARYAIVWRDYLLFPIDASLELGIPEVDASPSRIAAPHGTGAATLRIRCEAIERASDATRLDVLVCARSVASPVCTTTYLPDGSIDPEVWQGVAHGAVDVYAFTSTATLARRSLAELLSAERLDDAIATLRAADGDPRVGLARGASLQVAAAARRALAQADPAAATAFRGSFGADSAGAVRYRAAAVAFTLAIETIG